MVEVSSSVYSDTIGGRSIRLLKFRQNAGGTLAGKLKTFRLAEAPPFYTASYVWGEKTYSGTSIKLDSGSLPVLESLAPLLQLISEHGDFKDDDWWWVDSLCINLKDGQERTSQVGIMAKIYKQAKRVIVWLGNEIEGDSRCVGAISFLLYLSDLQLTFNSNEEAMRTNLLDPQYTGEWAAVSNFLARSWWKRVWTLQEFILPKEAKIFCGNNSISRGKFKSAMYSIFLCSTMHINRDFDHELVPRNAFDAAFNRRRIHQWYNKPHARGMSLVSMMAYLGNHSATDCRDRIYSVMGLVTERDRRIVGDPDYTTSISHLYAKLVRSFWNEYQSLDIICFVHIFSRYSGPVDPGPDDAVPWWAPDWRTQIEFASPVPLMASQSAGTHIGNFRPLHSTKWTVMYDAPGSRLRKFANVRFHANLLEMWCDGVILDTIHGLGGLVTPEIRCQSFVCAASDHALIQTSTIQQRAQRATMLPDDWLEMIARSLVLDRQDKYFRFQAPVQYVNDFLSLCHALLRGEQVNPSFSNWFEKNRNLQFGSHTLMDLVASTTPPMDDGSYFYIPPSTGRPHTIYPPSRADTLTLDDTDTFVTRFKDTALKKSRRLMVTTEGYVGMAPCRAEPGDAVVILFGCSIPLVLRKVGTREAWKLIGEAYVHGYMNGEVGRLLKKGTKSIHRFRLA